MDNTNLAPNQALYAARCESTFNRQNPFTKRLRQHPSPVNVPAYRLDTGVGGQSGQMVGS